MLKKYEPTKNNNGWTIHGHGDHDLPYVHYNDFSQCKAMCDFLNIEHEHTMEMKNLIESNQSIENYMKLMHNELLDILVNEAKLYAKLGSKHHTINGFGIGMIAPQILKHLAVDLGLCDIFEASDRFHMECI